jgi:competence protein ComEA
MTIDEPEVRWRDSLAAAAAHAYEAAHGSAIHETRRGLRLRMGWRQAIAGAICVALLTGGAWWFTRLPDAGTGLPVALASAPGGSGAPDAALQVVVDVAGAVETPGLVELRLGSRVSDAIDAAGGASADAVLDDINLARKVTDGEQIRVPRVGEDDEVSGGLVNINSASVEDLEQLPGVGPVLAQRIVADREAHGPFATLEDLSRVAGVGDAIVGALEAVATV